MKKEELVKILLSVAMSDGALDPKEIAHLGEICDRLGVERGLLQKLHWGIQKGEKIELPVPEALGDRLGVLEELVKVMLADGRIDDNEMTLIHKVAKTYRFTDEKVSALTKAALAAPPAPARQNPQGPSTSKDDRPAPAAAGSSAWRQRFKPPPRLAPLLLAAAAAAYFFWGREALAARKALGVKTVEACSAYLERFPNGRHADEIGLLKDKLAFESARKLDTADAYDAYLAAFPNATEQASARKFAEERLFEQASKSRDPAQLDAFLAKYPKSPSAAQALRLSEAGHYEAAAASKDPARLWKFLARFSTSPFANKALALTDDLEFSQAAQGRDSAALRAYLQKFPNGRSEGKAKALIEELAYEEAAATTDPGELRAFLERYPKGPFTAKAKDLRDRRLYEWATKAKDLAQITQFLKENPRNKYAADARGVKNRIWDEAIGSYEQAARENAGQNAVAFFKAALTHVKVTGENMVTIRFQRTLSFQDWEDFPEDVRAVVNAAFRKKDKPTPGSTAPASLRRSFTAGNLGSHEEKISEKIRQAMLRMFGEQFFKFRKQTGGTLPTQGVVFDVRYTIRNQYDKAGGRKFPGIYSRKSITTNARTGAQEGNDEFLGYLLGIEIQWDMNLTLPRGDKRHKIKEVSFPGVHISEEPEDGSDPYNAMSRRSFEEFGDKIAKHFGLP